MHSCLLRTLETALKLVNLKKIFNRQGTQDLSNQISRVRLFKSMEQGHQVIKEQILKQKFSL